MAGAAVRTEQLTKDYGSGRGVFDLDLEVREGEILGFLGPNGAGKSTTMRMLLGLARPTAGRAEVLGTDVLSARRRVGYLAGDFELYDQLTGADVLQYFARLRGDVGQDRIAALARAGRLAVVDTLEHLREIAVRRWEIEFDGDSPDPERFRRLPGVIEVDRNGAHLTVAFEGEADPVVKAAAEYPVRELRVRDDDLEQVFLRLYADGGG